MGSKPRGASSSLSPYDRAQASIETDGGGYWIIRFRG